MEDIIKTYQEAIDKSVPWARPSEYARSWWSDECAEAIKRAGRSRREAPDTEEYRELVKEKKRVVRTAKTIHNRRMVHEASITNNGIWKLAKWARTAGHLPRPIPQFPSLHAGDSEATSFEAKVEVLHKKFFPPPLVADLSDMQSYPYLESIQCDFKLTEDDIIPN